MSSTTRPFATLLLAARIDAEFSNTSESAYSNNLQLLCLAALVSSQASGVQPSEEGSKSRTAPNIITRSMSTRMSTSKTDLDEQNFTPTHARPNESYSASVASSKSPSPSPSLRHAFTASHRPYPAHQKLTARARQAWLRNERFVKRSSIGPHSVICSACGQTRKLDGRQEYYVTNWCKHRERCEEMFRIWARENANEQDDL